MNAYEQQQQELRQQRAAARIAQMQEAQRLADERNAARQLVAAGAQHIDNDEEVDEA